MRDNTKQRIAQLKNGEIPTGYKKTELGIFPCDWDLKPLESLLVFKNGVNADKEKYNNGVKMISVIDVLSDLPIYYNSIEGQVDIDSSTLRSFGVTYGDILFLRSSETSEDAGKSNVYLDCNKTATYSGFVIRGKKNAEYDPFFLNESLRVSEVRNQIVRSAAGSQHFNVGQESLKKVVVPFAPLSEQAKIAEILITWDKAIELYKKQIEKLKQFKKICLKKMFPAKRQTVPEWRFKGFTGEWEKRRIVDCCFQLSSTLNPQDTPNDYYVEYSMLAFDNGEVPDTVLGKTMNSARRIIDKPCLLINKLNVRKKRIWYVEQPEENAVSSAEFVPVSSEIIDLYCLKQIVQEYSFTAYLENHSSGSSNSQKRVDPHVIMSATIAFPSKDEQIMIRAFFERLEGSIFLYQRKLEAEQKRRKALQQYLLNGIVRV